MVTRFQNNRGPALDYDAKGHWVAYKDYQSLQMALREALEGWEGWLTIIGDPISQEVVPPEDLEADKRIAELRKQFLAEPQGTVK